MSSWSRSLQHCDKKLQGTCHQPGHRACLPHRGLNHHEVSLAMGSTATSHLEQFIYGVKQPDLLSSLVQANQTAGALELVLTQPAAIPDRDRQRLVNRETPTITVSAPAPLARVGSPTMDSPHVNPSPVMTSHRTTNLASLPLAGITRAIAREPTVIPNHL